MSKVSIESDLEGKTQEELLEIAKGLLQANRRKVISFEERVGPNFLELDPGANTLMVSGKRIGTIPLGYHEGAKRVDVVAATFPETCACDEKIGRPVMGGGWNFAVDATMDEFMFLARAAMGGLRGDAKLREKYPKLPEAPSDIPSIDELQSMPFAVKKIFSEAIVAFLWAGPLCASSPDETPKA